MALRSCTTKISGLLQMNSRCLRHAQLKTQPSFTGLAALGVWTENKGFGVGTHGEVVVVAQSSNCTRQSTVGYDYSKLYGPAPPAEQTIRTLLLKQACTDPDLWRQRTPRGNAPWTRPMQPRRGGCSACYSSLAGDGANSGSLPESIDPSLVIFDKDGTLIDVNTVWIPWMESHVQELEQATGLDLADKMYTAVGYCPKERAYEDGGLLAHATVAEIQECFVTVLIACGVEQSEAKSLVDNCCKDFDSGGHNTLEPLGDLPAIFTSLRSRGIKLAICTTDSREGTLSALDRLGLMSMVDKIVCGDDKDTKPKPHPETALGICKDLNVLPHQTVIIGDTVADTTMGRSAGLGLTIGVLSGAGNQKFLEKEADVVLNNVDELLDTLFPTNL